MVALAGPNPSGINRMMFVGLSDAAEEDAARFVCSGASGAGCPTAEAESTTWKRNPAKAAKTRRWFMGAQSKVAGEQGEVVAGYSNHSRYGQFPILTWAERCNAMFSGPGRVHNTTVIARAFRQSHEHPDALVRAPRRRLSHHRDSPVCGLNFLDSRAAECVRSPCSGCYGIRFSTNHIQIYDSALG
jgi:hypothetical protein